MTLTAPDLESLRGINEALDLEEVESGYLPLSRLLNLYVRASQSLFSVTDTFLGQPSMRVPYVIGIAGSVAVGKSTTARVLQALLARWPDHPSVDLVTTDGFLWPNAELEAQPDLVESWFIERFRALRETAFRRPENYFHRFAQMSEEDAIVGARAVWQAINWPNLEANIAPTRGRATLILEKGLDHKIERVFLRRP